MITVEQRKCPTEKHLEETNGDTNGLVAEAASATDNRSAKTQVAAVAAVTAVAAVPAVAPG